MCFPASAATRVYAPVSVVFCGIPMYPKPVVAVDVVAAVGVPVIVPFMATTDEPDVEPMVTVVLPPDEPVPMFTDLLPAVAPVTMLAVTLDVVPAIVSVVAAAPMVMVVGVASKARVAAFELIAEEFRFTDVEDTRFAVVVFVAFPIVTAEAFVPPIVIVPKLPVVLVPTSMVMAPELPEEPAAPVEIARAPEVPAPEATAPVLSVRVPEVVAVEVPVDIVTPPEAAAELPERTIMAPVVPEVVVVPVIKSIAPELADVVFAVKKSRSVVPVPPVIDVIPVSAWLADDD
jgi:hypothetical protein